MIVSNKQDIVNNNNSSNIPVSKKYVFNGFKNYTYNYTYVYIYIFPPGIFLLDYIKFY